MTVVGLFDPSFSVKECEVKDHHSSMYVLFIIIAISICGDRSGSVVECMTRDRVVVDSNLTGGTTLCP